ncbi:MAG: hypothetical protein K2X81_00610, partial [Candidatus Obscuribacterales bacterium]|nr:hypothetical protein [Candidatus Obscuribacterales bacterium]
MWKKIREPVILFFLAWHFAGVILWLSPQCPLRNQLLMPFIGYIKFFGLGQGWIMFDSPRNYNGYLTAVISFKDGQQKIWDFPRMEKLGIVEKMFKERYREWTNDFISDESRPYLWPDAARYIARLNNDPKDPPVSVSIVRHWIWIKPPEQGIDAALSTVDDGRKILYTGTISPED